MPQAVIINLRKPNRYLAVRQRSMKLHTMGIILSTAGCLSLAIASGCGQSGVRADNAAATKPNAAVERVTAAKPKRKTLRVETTQPAWIEAFEQTPLYSKLAGYVEHVHVDIGDSIKKDQSLVTLSIPELADEVAQKKA